MPKFLTFPTLYDEELQINISKLKQWNYLNPEQIKNGSQSSVKKIINNEKLPFDIIS